MYKISKLIIFLSIIIPNILTYSQEETPSPLGPGKGHKQNEIGISFGLGPIWQNGEFYSSCDCPSFKDGSGIVFTPGIIFQRDITNCIQWGGLLGLSFQHIKSSYKERENLIFNGQNGEIFTDVPVLFREQIDLSFNQIELMPFLQIYPADFIYFKLGLRAGIPFSTSVKHIKELLDEQIRLDNGETVHLSIGNGKEATIEDGKVDKVNSFLLSVVPALGFNFRLTGTLFMGVTYSFYVPLNNYSERGKDFKLSYWQVAIDLRYALSLRKWIEY